MEGILECNVNDPSIKNNSLLDSSSALDIEDTVSHHSHTTLPSGRYVGREVINIDETMVVGSRVSICGDVGHLWLR